jgi:hypothetical protein
LKSIIILSLLCSASAFSEEQKEYKPTDILRNIDLKISYLAKNKTCINKSTTHDEARACVKVLVKDFKSLQDFDLYKELGLKIKKNHERNI